MITDVQKIELDEVIVKNSISSEMLQYEAKQDFHLVKFNDKYFQMQKDHEKYLCTICLNNSKKPEQHQLPWKEVLIYFNYWVKTVAMTIPTEDKTKKITVPVVEQANVPKVVQKPEEELAYADMGKFSKSFVNMYNQAIKAELHCMFDLAALGYRVAFEYLLKDYILRQAKKEEHASIRSSSIIKCIRDYVSNDELKLLVYRSTWINDDQVIFSKWTEKQLLELKKMIELLVKSITVREELIKVESKL